MAVLRVRQAEHSEHAPHETPRMRAMREELVARIAQVLPYDEVIHPLPGVHIARASTPLEPLHSVLEPSLCLIAQGSKEVLLGESRYVYDPAHYLIATVELPRISQVLEASKERPYLSLRLELTPDLVSAVMLEAGYSALPRATEVRAIDVSLVDENLLDAALRLVRLIDRPDDVPVLLSLITREIIYRLLVSNQGARLRHLAFQGGYTPYIARAVALLRQDIAQPLRVEHLARELGMSVSGLHHQFKAVTALSPLQFQKRLRLQEARRLMLSEDLDAASAALRVGYRDASHFNREYKSLFGVPPMRDVQRLRIQDQLADMTNVAI